MVPFFGKRVCARTLRRFQGKTCGESATDVNLVDERNEGSFSLNSHLGLNLRVVQERKRNWCRRLVGEGVQRKGMRKLMFKVSFEDKRLYINTNIRCLVTL